MSFLKLTEEHKVAPEEVYKVSGGCRPLGGRSSRWAGQQQQEEEGGGLPAAAGAGDWTPGGSSRSRSSDRSGSSSDGSRVRSRRGI
jgi:hypothetical protein